MYRAVLVRLEQNNHQTLGRFTLFNGLDKVFDCVTLELPWEDNQTNISCVPKGVYKVSPRYSDKYKNHYILEDVPNRRYILIHYGNFNTDTRGCVLLGSRFAQINSDSLLDITASRRTISELLSITEGEGFELTIA
jgi:hypothetical protein